MTRFDLLGRILTAAALVALAITVGVWLVHEPLTAAPAAAPVKIAPEPILAPPAPARPATLLTTIEVPVEVEVVAEPPVAKPADPKPESKPACPPRRRGLFRHR